MKRSLLVPLCLTFAFACTESEPGGDGSMDDTDMEGDGDGDGDGDTMGDGDGDPTGDGDGDSTVPEVIATLTGVITDMDGAALPSPGLQFCGPVDEMGAVSLCIPVPVDEDGAFTIGAMTAGVWNMKTVHGPVDGRNFSGQAFQITVNEGDTLDYSMPPIAVPETDTVTPLAGATVVMIDDVLSVTVDPDLAMAPDFTAPTEVGGLEVPEEFWRVPEVEGASVIHAWAFAPFGVKSTEGGFDFTIDGNLGLAADETVTFYEITKDNGEQHEIATGTVNAEATAIDVVPVGEGLHELTWLLVVQ